MQLSLWVKIRLYVRIYGFACSQIVNFYSKLIFFSKSYLYKWLVYFTRVLNNDKISINNYNEGDV